MKKVIPEVIEYFCDACEDKLESKFADDFRVSTIEVLRDCSGHDMNEKSNQLQLCWDCFEKIGDIINLSNHKKIKPVKESQ